MYVCICKAVTDKQIRRAAAQGVDSLYELRERLGVGSGCGSCADMAEEILMQHQARRTAPSLYVPSAA
jgi:bacterioferritin-associated ferredoxin